MEAELENSSAFDDCNVTDVDISGSSVELLNKLDDGRWDINKLEYVDNDEIEVDIDDISDFIPLAVSSSVVQVIVVDFDWPEEIFLSEKEGVVKTECDVDDNDDSRSDDELLEADTNGNRDIGASVAVKLGDKGNWSDVDTVALDWKLVVTG